MKTLSKSFVHQNRKEFRKKLLKRYPRSFVDTVCNNVHTGKVKVAIDSKNRLFVKLGKV